MSNKAKTHLLLLDPPRRAASRKCLILACSAVLASAATLVFAHGSATGVVKERMELMEGMGDAMEILADMFKGEVPYDAETARAAALEIHSRAGEKITRLFPENSLDKPSEALPEIWKNWEEFESLAALAIDYSDALAKAAANPGGPGDPSETGEYGMGKGSMMQQGQGMMMDKGQGSMMGGGQGMMMGGKRGAGPDPEHLAEMPPQAAFMHLADTCNECHTQFRVEE
jgi:cytochrome c556